MKYRIKSDQSDSVAQTDDVDIITRLADGLKPIVNNIDIQITEGGFEKTEMKVKGNETMVTDHWGALLIADPYKDKKTGEERVLLYMDNEDRDCRQIVEDNNLAVDIKIETLQLFMKLLQ